MDRYPREELSRNGPRHTRISGAWVTVFVAVLFGVELIDFIVQNIRSVRIEIFSVNGHTPVAVALLAATLASAFIVLGGGHMSYDATTYRVRRRTHGANLNSKIDVEGDHSTMTSLLDEQRVMYLSDDLAIQKAKVDRVRGDVVSTECDVRSSRIGPPPTLVSSVVMPTISPYWSMSQCTLSRGDLLLTEYPVSRNAGK